MRANVTTRANGTPPVTAAGWDPYNRDCPTRQLLDRIGDRWTVLVVGALADGPLRFGRIARRVDGISQKMLTQTLRALERDGLVSRTAYPEIPPRVEYELTAIGRTLCGPLTVLERWAIDHMQAVTEARAAYDVTADSPTIDGPVSEFSATGGRTAGGPIADTAAGERVSPGRAG